MIPEFVVALALLAGQSVSAIPIDRFSCVDARLCRGGQPDTEGFAHLRALGVQTVINLRQDDRERPLVESLGMRFVHIPIRLRPFGRNAGALEIAAARFFEEVDDPDGGLVFVHCRRGADRTGVLVALYRIARHGWTAEQAYREARTIGMRWWYFPLKGILQQLVACGQPTTPAVPDCLHRPVEPSP